ncbi:MAG: DUF885 family protein, partial [Terriglobales bacterium]
MIRKLTSLLIATFLTLTAAAQDPVADRTWIATSNKYANLLTEVNFKHHPEAASAQGLSEFDTRIAQPTLADEDQERQETVAALAKLKGASAEKQPREVAQDLQIMIRRVELGFKEADFARAHKVSFFNASARVFSGLQILLDEQTPPDRRQAAVVRIREYAGLEPGYTAITEILKQRITEQMAKSGVIYPARVEIETEMGRNSNYVDGIAALMKKYNLNGWQEPFGKLKMQLADYDAWIRATVLPKARTDFRLPPEEYALNLEAFGIDIPPEQVAAMAHQAFAEIQGEMKSIALTIAQQRRLPSSDYRDVVRELKKHQLVGDAILPFYEERLKQIEKIIVEQQIVSLPERPARIRLATAAE